MLVASSISAPLSSIVSRQPLVGGPRLEHLTHTIITFQLRFCKLSITLTWLHHFTFGLVRSLAALALGRGKYGGNGGNLSHFGNIIISPDRRPNPGHVEKLSLRSVFFNTFTVLQSSLLISHPQHCVIRHSALLKVEVEKIWHSWVICHFKMIFPKWETAMLLSCCLKANR